MKRLCIVHNPSAGSTDSEQSIREAFERHEVELIFVSIGTDLPEQLKKVVTAGVDVLVAAGGDGTVNAVAQFAAGTEHVMAVLPLGTLNHFAKDIGMPTDLGDAVSAVVDGNIEALDYATVNGSVFINNSSIGIYPNLVRGRDRLSDHLGKWPAVVVAWFRVVKDMTAHHLRITFDDQQYSLRTPLVFIGNNDYHLEQTGFSNRTSLQAGQLSIYVIRANTLFRFFRLGFGILLGKALQDTDFIEAQTTSCVIHSSHRKVHVSMDGEVKLLHTPLQYAVHAGGLQVCVPSIV